MTERRRSTRQGELALHLLGVTVNDAHTGDIVVPDVQLVSVRELSAICTYVEYHEVDADDVVVSRAKDILSAFVAHGPVLPAPIGVVFRGEESVQRWLELHYSTISEALSFVENRVAARVHVWRTGPPEEREAGVDLAAIAAESMRVLRRAAVATLPLRAEKVSGIVLSAAFLVEDELWKNFVEEVEAQGTTEKSVRFAVTGPWPPYDFVQMQLGS